jgi:hypothetical protein
MGKKTGMSPETGWGTIQILVYPSGTEMPPAKLAQNSTPPKTTAEPPVAQSPTTVPKPE